VNFVVNLLIFAEKPVAVLSMILNSNQTAEQALTHK